MAMPKGCNFNHPKRGSTIKVEPIRSITAIRRIKQKLSNPRDRCLFTLGINSAFRAGDLLSITVDQVLHIKPGQELEIKESKTGKYRRITLNRASIMSIKKLVAHSELEADDHLFVGQRGPLTVPTLNRLVKGWCREAGLKGNYGSHTLRKTWGYMMRTKYRASVPLLMACFGHSSQQQTLAYLGVQDSEIKRLYRNEL